MCRVLPRAQREAVEVAFNAEIILEHDISWGPRLCQFGVPEDSRVRNHCVVLLDSWQASQVGSSAVPPARIVGAGMAEVAASLERMACFECHPVFLGSP